MHLTDIPMKWTPFFPPQNEVEKRCILSFFKEGPMSNVTLTGIDLSKNVFELRFENHVGKCLGCKSVSRDRLMSHMAQLPKGSKVAMEACSSAHYWAKRFMELGLEVVLIAPHLVRPYRLNQKNDRNDAFAICRAARQPGMPFVAVKSDEQLELQALHRIRARLNHDRTALNNQIRGFLAEKGIVIAKSASQFKKCMPIVLSKMEGAFGFLLGELWAEFLELDKKFEKFTKRITLEAKKNEKCQAICALDGVGPMVSTAVIAVMGRPQNYKNGRAFAAFTGLVPKQFTTGGKPKLGSITKRGDNNLRCLLVHGARSAVRAAIRKKKTDALSLWIRKLLETHEINLVVVALANKIARRIWAILAGKKPRCEQPMLPMAA